MNWLRWLQSPSRSVICVAIFAITPGIAIRAGAQSPQSLVPINLSVLLRHESSKVIAVGLLGGFVHHNDSHHPEPQLIRELQQRYPTGAYFALFENHKIDEAHKAILQQLNLDHNNKQPVRIVLFGHSWGATAVVRLSRTLERDGIPVALTVQIDAVGKPFSDDSLIPPNVAEVANFYQTHGLIHGRSPIRVADPERTRVMGNFRPEYKSEPAPCRRFPWHSCLFTKGHIEIECDPDVWSQVKLLLAPYLPNESLAQNQPAVLQDQSTTSAREFTRSERIETFEFENQRR
jgi:pimeloyl-ACP methyl ester carboxylesterase